MKITCLSLVRSPLTHMMGSEGNESVVNREPVMTAAGLRYVPVLSGNALRNRMVRAPSARYLVERYGWKETLSVDQLNFLFHGGRLTRKGGRVDLRLQERVATVFPFLRLLGCSLPGQIMAGSLYVARGVLLCQENTERIAKQIPPDFDVPRPPRVPLRPAISYVEPWNYYRQHVTTTEPDLVPTDADEEHDDTRMIMAGQSVIPGAAFIHGFHVTRPTDLQVGCLLFALRKWRDAKGTIGGYSRAGHGRLEMLTHVDEEANEDKLIRGYLKHVDAVAEDARDLLAEIFEGAGDG